MSKKPNLGWYICLKKNTFVESFEKRHECFKYNLKRNAIHSELEHLTTTYYNYKRE